MTFIQLLFAATFFTQAVNAYAGDRTSGVLAFLFLSLALAAIVYGWISDEVHARKVREGKASYRLPFRLRWDDWMVGNAPDHICWQESQYYDPREKRLVPIYRSVPGTEHLLKHT